MDRLENQYERDRSVWNRCANTYEKKIVGGHPDILAFENFEENLIDSVLRHIAQTRERPIKLLDVGCGSGRLHLRYGVKTIDTDERPDVHALVQLKKSDCDLLYDPLLEKKLEEVFGVDFSGQMIRLAERNLKQTELWGIRRPRLVLEEGSAFDLEPESDRVFPVAVCLVNSIGVMQGARGAKAIFQSMRRAVEAAGGVALISCYRKEYLQTYGLNQYESTMDVSGQPNWLASNRFSEPEFLSVPQYYKQAYDLSPFIRVNIHDRNTGLLVEKDVILERDRQKTEDVLETGHIQTHGDYESNWYAFDRIDRWIEEFWGDETYHLKSWELDALRARPAQVAIYDPRGGLKDLIQRWSEDR